MRLAAWTSIWIARPLRPKGEGSGPFRPSGGPQCGGDAPYQDATANRDRLFQPAKSPEDDVTTDADPIRSVRARSVPTRIHLAGPDRDLEHVLPGRDGAVVMGREGAGRVVRPVEVEHVAVGVPGDRLRLEVAPHR